MVSNFWHYFYIISKIQNLHELLRNLGEVASVSWECGSFCPLPSIYNQQDTHYPTGVSPHSKPGHWRNTCTWHIWRWVELEEPSEQHQNWESNSRSPNHSPGDPGNGSGAHDPGNPSGIGDPSSQATTIAPVMHLAQQVQGAKWMLPNKARRLLKLRETKNVCYILTCRKKRRPVIPNHLNC